jgi:hypothetical protein
MMRLNSVAVTLTLPLLFITALSATDATAQSAKEQIVGAWTMASADSVRPDGSRVAMFGSNPKGIMIFSRDGHFALIQMRAELPRIAAKSRDQGTPEENKAIVQGSIAYFGTYAVNEADKSLTLNLEGSTFVNVLAQGEQKRVITVLTSDELKFTNPKTPSGATLEVGGSAPDKVSREELDDVQPRVRADAPEAVRVDNTSGVARAAQRER